MADRKIADLTASTLTEADEVEVYRPSDPTSGRRAPITVAQLRTLLGITAAAATVLDDATVAAMLVTMGGLALAGGTMSGAVAFADQVLSAPELRDVAETVQIATGVNGSISYAYTAGAILDLTLSGNVTAFAITAPPATGKGGAVTVILRATNSRTFAWPTGTIWAAGAPPTLSAGAAAIDVFTLISVNAGSAWFGFTGGKAFA